MAYPTISTLPPAPSRSNPDTFASLSDAFVASLAGFQSETNNAGVYIDGKAATVETDASTSATNAAAAAVSATAAANSAATAGAVAWVSGTAYVVGNVVYSGINYLNYRAIQSTSGTTDPSLNDTDWVSLAGTPFTTGKAIAVALVFG